MEEKGKKNEESRPLNIDSKLYVQHPTLFRSLTSERM